jgi:hypothetical protein
MQQQLGLHHQILLEYTGCQAHIVQESSLWFVRLILHRRQHPMLWH